MDTDKNTRRGAYVDQYLYTTDYSQVTDGTKFDRQ